MMDGLDSELIAFARERISPVKAPREIEIVESLPRTESGKLLKRVLLGAAIVLLGVAWHPVRNQLIRALPKWHVFHRPMNRPETVMRLDRSGAAPTSAP